jgi:adenosylhomocysteine nucleosidase
MTGMAIALGKSSSITAVVAALPEEMAPFRRRLTGVRRTGKLPPGVVLAQLGSAPLALLVTGDGETNAREAVRELFSAVPVRRLLVIGISGALSPNLVAGSLVVGERVLDERGSVLEADAKLTCAAAERVRAERGVLVSATKIADTLAEKQRLLQLVSMPRTVAAVDLESAVLAAAAEQAQIPWLILRAISDTAEEALPAVLNASRDERGAVRRGAVLLGVLRGLLSDPRLLPALLALRRRLEGCARGLARGAEVVLTELEDEWREAAAHRMSGSGLYGQQPFQDAGEQRAT